MAQDLGLDFSGGLVSWAHGVFASAINDGNSAQTAAENLGAQTGQELGFELKLACGAGTVDGVVAARILWSRDGADFEAEGLGEIIAHITPVASSTVTRNFSAPVMARWFKLAIVNASGVQITTSSALDYEVIYGNQA